MEDTFQFIIESPQHNTGHKKRPRLVTSCDNCRLKKIKCLQPSPETKCEACKAAKIPCRFKDRERYFAERSRAIAGPSVNAPAYGADHRHDSNPALDAFSVASSSSSPSLSNAALRSNSHSPKASGLVSPEGEANGRYPYPSDPRRGDPNYRHSANSSISSFHSRNNSYGYSNYAGSPAPALHQPLNSRPPTQADYRHVQLFDPDRPHYPHPSLIHQFVQAFFENNLGNEFPFLTYEQLMNDAWENRLPPAIANVVAAMASRYSNVPELTIRGLHNVAEAYLEMAKTQVATPPSMETLHAIMLIAWSEYKNNRHPNFRHFTHNAVTMAQDLGLSDPEPPVQITDAERRRRQLTWTNILQLHTIAAANRA
ncbi:hypothetical protein D9611_000077 [Ephemerocybe angulata]|uniref:Zn(2)-C6 fungal-type domain-containing protein n=1 Tax=Ephemerocybe angulata TaxID=980116 RepID=A0A8H5BMU2_9AGAR|nr:hypothetical protein D9611_000077 [Tulosesus angulatus]